MPVFKMCIPCCHCSSLSIVLFPSCCQPECTQIEPRLAGGNAERETTHKESLHYFREATSRPFLAAGGFKRESAIKAIADGKADAVVFGEWC